MVHHFFPPSNLCLPTVSRTQITSQRHSGRICQWVSSSQAPTLQYNVSSAWLTLSMIMMRLGKRWVYSFFCNEYYQLTTGSLYGVHRGFTCWQRDCKASWIDYRVIMSISKGTCYDCKMSNCFHILKIQDDIGSSLGAFSHSDPLEF
jgi:hypothetical protein